MSGFKTNEDGLSKLRAYANQQLAQSYEYLLLRANFGTYVKNRPGFEKQFRELSEKAWDNAIGLIKHITKRGGTHDFRARSTTLPTSDAPKTLDMHEMSALAYALQKEKVLAKSAHEIHETYNKANIQKNYDPEVIIRFLFGSL